MLTIQWFAAVPADGAVHTEATTLRVVDEVVESARSRLSMMKTKVAPPPIGFVVYDDHGRELARWFEPAKS